MFYVSVVIRLLYTDRGKTNFNQMLRKLNCNIFNNIFLFNLELNTTYKKYIQNTVHIFIRDHKHFWTYINKKKKKKIGFPSSMR